MMPQILVIGQGDIGLPATNTLATEGYAVTGLARNSRSHYELVDQAKFMQADALTLTCDQLQAFSHIAIIVTPDEYSTSGYYASYLAICEHLAQLEDELPNLEHIVFISSTGVYGQDNGEWIDEHTVPTQPKREASKVILQAEQALQRGFANKAVIIRPSGIYGRERLMRVRKARDANKEAITPEHWSNRIMDRDLVTIIVKVLTAESTEMVKSLYIATDYMPVTTLELDAWLSKQVGTAPAESESEKSSTAGATGKRLHSNIPLTWLHYPDWQSGYLDILQHQED